MSARAARPAERGDLVLVLHSHMPYVEGFGTWPFGEEWLWEAVATVYVPLLEALREAPVTVGLTPVLCDQLETLTGPAGERFLDFARGVRGGIHAEDAAGFDEVREHALAAEIRRAAADYERAADAFAALGGDLLGAYGRLAEDGPVELVTSAATHAVLPLLATDAGLRLQLCTGMAAHERRFGAPSRAFWLPECAYEPGLERALAEHDIRAFFVDQTAAHGLGAPEHLEPVATEAGPVAVPIDWQQVALVWSADGYPCRAPYRDTHRRTWQDLKPWANHGGPYDHAAAIAAAREHARDFVARAAARLDAYAAERRGRRGLLACALDTELLGHWWYEGIEWLSAVVEEAYRQGVRLATLSDALERAEPVTDRTLAPSTWGQPKDMSTWDSALVAGPAFDARRREVDLVLAASRRSRNGANGANGDAALLRATRELLALQQSDWAFQLTRELAADYPLRRMADHAARMDAALAALAHSAPDPEPELRNLAPELDLSPLVAP